MLTRSLFVVLIAVLISACQEDEEGVPSGSLAAYFRESELVVINDLIACAANNKDTLANGLEDSVSIFFLPISGASQFSYFETEHAELDPHDHSLYQQVSLADLPVFGGHLRRFVREGTTVQKWCVVAFERNDSLFYSNPILLKSPDLNTEINESLLSINQSETLSPKFSWQDGNIDENVIYFQVISDDQDNLISGTYTIEKSFQFYDLSNVVLNVNDVTPAPALEENRSYYFTLMAVSIDNWVNLVIRVPFDTML